jgi:ABC-type dipeptide/oligopeptide/nickel transport system ATPase subunit
MSQPWDYIAKLVCIGDSGTGKSSVSAVALSVEKPVADHLLIIV